MNALEAESELSKAAELAHLRERLVEMDGPAARELDKAPARPRISREITRVRRRISELESEIGI